MQPGIVWEGLLDAGPEPQTHLEVIPASALRKCLAVIPSNILKSNGFQEIARRQTYPFQRSYLPHTHLHIHSVSERWNRKWDYSVVWYWSSEAVPEAGLDVYLNLLPRRMT